MKSLKALSALTLAALSTSVYTYTVPPGSPGFYHGNSSAAVTFDEHSLFIDDKRLFVFSGEIHPWRIPSGKPVWRDIFQKLKAAGFNSISVYLHWGVTEGKRGELNFDYYRSHIDVYEVAQEVGLFVVSRPGPYINAETNAGGFPSWLTNVPAKARTNQTGYTEAWLPWIKATAKFIEPFQYPNGPVIAVQSENEFEESSASNPGRSEHMALLEDTFRANGVTKVPLTHNDAGTNGVFAHGLGQVDLYMWDSYPQGFACSNPTSWPELDTVRLDTAHQRYVPDEPWATGEFQGGAFDPWGGSGYDACYVLTNEQFANVYYKNNYAAQTTYQNLYMSYGGTNWGNLAEPTVYTSYDYGAPIREDRTLSNKYSEVKLQAEFLHASSEFLVATRFGNGTVGAGTAFSDNPNIYTQALSSPNGTHFYIITQRTNKNLTPTQFSIRVNTTEGEITIPKFGGNATLDGREAQIIVSEYPYGSHKLKYSTAEVFTWATIGGVDYLVLYAHEGHAIESAITVAQGTTAKVTGSSGIKAHIENGTAIITGSPSGVSQVNLGKTVVFVADKRTAYTFWNTHLSTENKHDASPDNPSVLVFGPYLVRNATLDNGSTHLTLHGDLNATTTLDIVAPPSIRTVSWNGNQVNVKKSDIGTLRGTLKFNLKTPTLPNLKKVAWTCTDSLPEIKDRFDDSKWVTANKTSTQRPYPSLGGKFILYTDEYGFHQGNTITRGHFTGKNATGVRLSVQGGFNFGYSAWLNSKFLGSNEGKNQYTPGGGVDLTNDTFTFDPADLKDGDNVLTVVLDPTGLEEDYNGEDTFKTPRGIRGYELLGGVDFDHWKIQGNLGGEDFPDKVRGPLNEGGLFVEREGAHLPGFSTKGWTRSTTSSPCDPYTGISSAGIQAYRTTFNLDLPAASDIPIALKFERTPSSSYRSVIFINGWQFGRFNSKDGPQTMFPLPEGILNHQGKNELLVTLWSLDAEGAKVADLELVSTAVISSSKEYAKGIVPSPGYADLRG